jgi:hypothetical protein
MFQKSRYQAIKVNVQNKCNFSTRILNLPIVVTEASAEQNPSRLNIVRQHGERVLDTRLTRAASVEMSMSMASRWDDVVDNLLKVSAMVDYMGVRARRLAQRMARRPFVLSIGGRGVQAASRARARMLMV